MVAMGFIRSHYIERLSNQPMPLINLRTNVSDVQAPDALLKKLSDALASATGKPESYVMTLLESGVPMTFAGSEEPCAYVEIKSIGALTPPQCLINFAS